MRLISHFTGIDSAYEVPLDPEMRLTTLGWTPAQNACAIVDYLREGGYLR